MNRSEIIKINQLRDKLNSIKFVIDSLKEEYEKLKICKQQISDSWSSYSSEIYLSKLDEKIRELNSCIDHAENIYSKIKKHIDTQTKNVKNKNLL